MKCVSKGRELKIPANFDQILSYEEKLLQVTHFKVQNLIKLSVLEDYESFIAQSSCFLILHILLASPLKGRDFSDLITNKVKHQQ